MRMGRLLFVFLFSALFMAAPFANEAQAATVGSLIDNTLLSWNGLANFMVMISYISGAFLSVSALLKFKDHVDNPHQTKISEGVKRFLAGGMFLSLPYMMVVLRATIFADDDSFLTNTGFTPGGVLTPGALDFMVVSFIGDIAEPTESLLTAFCYLSGIALLMVGISRLTKRMEEGPRGPAGMGTLMTFIAAGALMSFGSSMSSFAASLFGDAELMTMAEVDPNGNLGLSAIDAQKIGAVIEGLMVFIMLVGYIAFIRGWFVLKAFADGQQGATLAQGLTFLFGGTLAINLGELVNALQTTVGINGISFG